MVAGSSYVPTTKVNFEITKNLFCQILIDILLLEIETGIIHII